MAKIGPIKAAEIANQKKTHFPDAVFESFNEMIVEDFNNRSATVRQDAVVKLMVEKGLKRDEIFKKGWLNVEDVYRAEGWKVEYDKPGYNESGEAYFTFSAR